MGVNPQHEYSRNSKRTLKNRGLIPINKIFCTRPTVLTHSNKQLCAPKHPQKERWLSHMRLGHIWTWWEMVAGLTPSGHSYCLALPALGRAPIDHVPLRDVRELEASYQKIDALSPHGFPMKPG